jgi:NADPH-dependent ferric siderophore reductase
MDTDLLAKIWGPGGGAHVQEMMGVWDAARIRLYAAAQQVLTSSETDFPGRKNPFKDALKDLCAKTEIMNREYTLRALHAVAEEIGGSCTGGEAGQLQPGIAAE